MHDLNIAEMYTWGYLSAADSMGLSSLSWTQFAPEKAI